MMIEGEMVRGRGRENRRVAYGKGENGRLEKVMAM